MPVGFCCEQQSACSEMSSTVVLVDSFRKIKGFDLIKGSSVLRHDEQILRTDGVVKYGHTIMPIKRKCVNVLARTTVEFVNRCESSACKVDKTNVIRKPNKQTAVIPSK